MIKIVGLDFKVMKSTTSDLLLWLTLLLLLFIIIINLNFTWIYSKQNILFLTLLTEGFLNLNPLKNFIKITNWNKNF